MTAWNVLSSREKAFVMRTYEALTLLDQTNDQATQEIGFSDLYAYATNRPVKRADVIEAALRKPHIRSSLQRLLWKTAQYAIPRAAAASTGTLMVRETEDFRIHLKPSKAEPEQVYIIIDLPKGSTYMPKTLFILHEDTGCIRQPLPEPLDDQIQLLTTSDSELVRGLTNHQTEIFLR